MKLHAALLALPLLGITSLACAHGPVVRCPNETTHEAGSACVAPDGRIVTVVFPEPGDGDSLVAYPVALKIEEYDEAAERFADDGGSSGDLWLSSSHWTGSGKLAGITVNLRGTKRSVSILFHENGLQSLYKEEENGKGQGLIRSWHPNGVLRWSGEMRDGHPDGVHLFWDESGHFEKQIVWDMGVLRSESTTAPD